ncbi:MAG TPA: hypothetical protein VI138_00135 [Candidatus Dormibacteraeota bacterium]
MAVRDRQEHPSRGRLGYLDRGPWRLAVSVLGGWLRQQSARPGPIGEAASVAALVVNRSAQVVSDVSAEVARATAGEGDREPKRSHGRPGGHRRRPVAKRARS